MSDDEILELARKAYDKTLVPRLKPDPNVFFYEDDSQKRACLLGAACHALGAKIHSHMEAVKLLSRDNMWCLGVSRGFCPDKFAPLPGKNQELEAGFAFGQRCQTIFLKEQV